MSFPRSYFDAFSVVHGAWGAVFELSNIPAPLALGAQLGFEVGQSAVERSYPALYPAGAARPDGADKMLGNLASFAGGYYLSRAVKGAPVGRLLLLGVGALSGAIWLSSVFGDRGR